MDTGSEGFVKDQADSAVCFLAGPPDWVGHDYFTRPLYSQSPFFFTKPHIPSSLHQQDHSGLLMDFFHRSRDRMRSLSLSGVSIGFTRWAPSQPFSGSPPHLKGREWGDVRLILDTKVERVAEQKKRSTRQDLEGRWVNSNGIGAGDTSQKIHTVPFVIIMGEKKTKNTDVFLSR